ncbi:MucR family transcriptional regulator [Phenylobacterium sp.]|uniref:MucR family transcriptional regulator n=1 Tax=Phenylobacterium sp. TaxID=1871053 RepID=UPI0011FF217F|nr:MucR family transcriptional regulator [Phenylobacterium sp.]THD57471.1 MAG: MucR family transcriptional regulator [Phenylobacterium sp.]
MADTTLLVLTTQIVSNYLEKNRSSIGELPALIASVHGALMQPTPAPPTEEASAPSTAQIRRSIRPDGIVSFIDGRTYQQLKRHLSTHGFTPQTYREKFGLPNDYPIVAAVYSAQRSALAKAAGLGSKRRGKTTKAKAPKR